MTTLKVSWWHQPLNSHSWCYVVNRKHQLSHGVSHKPLNKNNECFLSHTSCRTSVLTCGWHIQYNTTHMNQNRDLSVLFVSLTKCLMMERNSVHLFKYCHTLTNNFEALLRKCFWCFWYFKLPVHSMLEANLHFLFHYNHLIILVSAYFCGLCTASDQTEAIFKCYFLSYIKSIFGAPLYTYLYIFCSVHILYIHIFEFIRYWWVVFLIRKVVAPLFKNDLICIEMLKTSCCFFQNI